MKKSEFAEIVNAVELEERKRLAEVIACSDGAKNLELDKLIATIAVEVSAVSARTTAEILTRSGILHLDD